MDAAQEARCKEMLDQILAMATKMASDLEACNAAFRAAHPVSVVSSDDLASKPVTTTSTSPTPSPTSAPSQDVAPDLQFGVSNLLDTSHTRCSMLGHYQGAHVAASENKSSATPSELSYIHHALPDGGQPCILFDTDGGGVDRLSHLPNSLLCDIVARLPIKDAARTAVLSHRWGIIRRAAPLLVNYNNLASNLMGVTVLATSPTRCSTLSLCQAVSLERSTSSSTLFPPPEVSLFTSNKLMKIPTAPPIDRYLGSYSLQVACTGPCHKVANHGKLCYDDVIEGNKILQDCDDIRNGRGCRQPKPPWLLGAELSRSWFGRLQLISGFLLEASPWCSDHTLWVQWLYQYDCVPMKTIIYQDTKVDSLITNTEHLPVLHAN